MNRTTIPTILFISIFLICSCFQGKRNRLNIVFDNVEDLEKGAEVKLQGVPIGEVTNLELLDDSVLVEIRFNKEQRIPVGSKISITSSLVGHASIVIDPSDQKTFLTSTDTVSGKYMHLEVLSDSVKKGKAKNAIEKIVTGIKELVELNKDSIPNK